MELSLLKGSLPETVKVEEKEYPIFTDFRRWIQVEALLFEKRHAFTEKLPELLKLCYPRLPETIGEAIQGIVSFYKGGAFQWTAGGKSGENRPLYSFCQDEAMIYAGFFQQYGLDLLTADLHWWQFKALLSGLSENTAFMQIMHYRSVNIAEVKNPKEKKFYRRMKELYRLQDNRTENEREAAISEVFAKLF